MDKGKRVICNQEERERGQTESMSPMKLCDTKVRMSKRKREGNNEEERMPKAVGMKNNEEQNNRNKQQNNNKEHTAT